MKEQEQKHNGFPPSNLPRDPETGYFLDVPARIREIYKHNCFMSDFFHICGGAQVSLHIEHDKHANHRNVTHGGVLTALADSVLGVTGASVGEAVVTVNFSMDFISNVSMDGTNRRNTQQVVITEAHMKTNLILINNDIVDAEEINVHPFNRGHQFGDGVYEIVPVYNGKALHAEMHMENLLNALVQIKVPGFYMVEEMVEFTSRMIEAAEVTDGLLYTQVTRGIGPYELDFPEQCEPELIMQAVPLNRDTLAEQRKTGVNLITVPDERAVKCELNTLNRLPEILAKNKARIGKCYDALFVRDEKITEATEAAFMIVKDELLWTYPMKLGSVHQNVTRQLVKEKLAATLDMQVIEKAFTKEFALEAEEAFLCGYRCEIMPVAKIDRRPVADGKPGKVTLKLQAAFEEYIREQTK